MTTNQKNILVGVPFVLMFIFLCWFFAVVIGASSGEAAGALGGVIGGAIGAGGAGLSVYYSIQRQRQDEIDKTSYAVLTEIAVFTKYIVGHLGFCQMVKEGFPFPRAQLPTVFLMPEPIIYKSVADKIAYLPRATQVVEFYTRMGEMSGLISLIMYSPLSENPSIEPVETYGLADLLITQCQFVEALLSNTVHDRHSEAFLAEGLRSHMLGILRQQLEQAKRAFPNSEAFK